MKVSIKYGVVFLAVQRYAEAYAFTDDELENVKSHINNFDDVLVKKILRDSIKNYKRIVDDFLNEHKTKTEQDSPIYQTINKLLADYDIGLNRNLDPSFQASLIPFFGYGCWCDFRSTHQRIGYHGTPVDEVDQLCRQVSDCYRCTNIDAKNEVPSEKCNPFTTDYTSVSSKVVSISDFASQEQYHNYVCNIEDNKTNCQKRTCTCDKDFFAKMWNLLITTGLNNDFKHPSRGGTFDVQSSCAFNPTSGQNEVGCCGTYPLRYVFHTKERACCGDKTYDFVLQQCCADFSVESPGEC